MSDDPRTRAFLLALSLRDRSEECTGSYYECSENGNAGCPTCSEGDCPHADPLHYDADGCPSCMTSTNDVEET